MVNPVVKAAFVPFPATGGNPANACVARLCGVSPCPVPDTATALPNQARYQLRYTRIFSSCHYITTERKIKDFSVCGHSCGQNRFCAVFCNREKSRKRRCRKALRRFASPYPGYNHGTPKSHATPTGLHLNTVTLYHGQIRKSKKNLCARIGGTQILMTWVPQFWVTRRHSIWRWALLTGAGRVRGSLGYGLDSRIGCRCSRRCGGRRSFWTDPGCRSWGRPR